MTVGGKTLTRGYFQEILTHVRGYFVFEYHGGTREMIYRYVARKMGDVPPQLISAALRILRDNRAITYEKKVWWYLGDR